MTTHSINDRIPKRAARQHLRRYKGWRIRRAGGLYLSAKAGAEFGSHKLTHAKRTIERIERGTLSVHDLTSIKIKEDV